MIDQFTSDLAHVQLHDTGWVRLPSGPAPAPLQMIQRLSMFHADQLRHTDYATTTHVARDLPGGVVEVTRLPLWDSQHRVFARLGHGPVSKWAAERDWRLPTTEECDRLHSIALFIKPKCMVFTDADHLQMSTLAWCKKHDSAVWERLEAANWNGQQPVSNAGKHWCAPVGGIYGWWTEPGKAPSGPVEPPDPTGDTDPAPASGGVPGPSSWRPVLRRGMRGADVAAWQDVLIAAGHGEQLAPWGADGDFGALTEAATKAWQAARHLVPDGIVGPRTRAAIGTPPVEVVPPAVVPGEPDPEWLSNIALVQAANYSPGPFPFCDWVIVHSTENPPGPGVALGVARWFAGRDWRGNPVAAPLASSHYVIGGDTSPLSGVFRCVKSADRAWTAGVRAVNVRATNLEIVGQALKSDWSGEPMRTTMQRAAAVARHEANRWSIPWVSLSDAALDEAAQRMRDQPNAPLPERCRGLCSHADITRAWHVSGGHQDPGGPGDRRWPWELFLSLA